MNAFESTLTRLHESYRTLSMTERVYAIAVSVLLATCLLSTFAEPSMLTPLIWMVALALAGAFVSEAYVKLARAMSAPLTKWISIPVATLVGALVLGQSSNLINAATAQDPDLFPRAIAFMAFPAFLELIALLVACTAVLATGLLICPWPRRATAWRELILLGRMMAGLATFAIASYAFTQIRGFEQSLSKLGGVMAMQLDMHRDQRCAPGEHERVRRVNDDLVVVASRAGNGVTFKRQACTLTAD